MHLDPGPAPTVSAVSSPATMIVAEVSALSKFGMYFLVMPALATIQNFSVLSEEAVMKRISAIRTSKARRKVYVFDVLVSIRMLVVYAHYA